MAELAKIALDDQGVVRVPVFRKQRDFLRAILDPDVDQVCYGGSRGGGKSEALRIAMLMRALLYPGTNHILFRRTSDDVVKQHAPKFKALMRQWGVKFNYNQTYKMFTLANGSFIYLAFADSLKHCEKHQGLEYMTVAFDEATQFPENIYTTITSSSRNAQQEDARIKILLSCNPGGVGHRWVKKRFIDARTRDAKTAFIQAKLYDNPILMKNDPTYGERLTRHLPEWQRRQWLEGDWDAAEGAYFELPPGAVCEVHPSQFQYARWYAGVDWGYFPSAFAVVWMATWRDLKSGRPRAHLFRDMKRHKLDIKAQANEALLMEQMLPVSRPKVRYADPSTGKRLEGESDETARTTAREWRRYGFTTVPAKRHARVPGWMLLRMMLAAREEYGGAHGVLTIDPSCQATIQEIGDATYEMSGGQITGDDLDGEDHLLDSIRYMLTMVYGISAPRIPTGDYDLISELEKTRSLLTA